MENQLVSIEGKNEIEIFSTKGGLNPIIEEVKKIVEEFEHDLSTAAGRKRTASLANQVARSKTYLDARGKDLVSDWKTKAKAVDAERKNMRDTLDALKEEARKPLSEWEAEEQEKVVLAAAKAKAFEEAVELEEDHEIALLLNREFNRDLQEKREQELKQEAEYQARIKLEQEEREKQIAEQAAAKAKADAEQALKEAAQREEQSKVQAENDRVEKIRLEERAKAQAEQAEVARVEAAQQAKINADNAAKAAQQAEIDRQESAKRQEQAELAEREANKAHIGKIRKAAKEALVLECGLTEDQAKSVILAINSGKVPAIKINY